MCASFEAVNNKLTERKDKKNVLDVNTDKEHHEENK